MALKTTRPPAGAGRGSKKAARKPVRATKLAGDLAKNGLSEPRHEVPTETIEERLERKSAVADTATFTTKSLGQISRARRHKLLYGD